VYREKDVGKNSEYIDEWEDFEELDWKTEDSKIKDQKTEDFKIKKT
jgi:hypothetical protein